MNEKPNKIQKLLDERLKVQALRKLPDNSSCGLDFLSNDYLGLSKSTQITYDTSKSLSNGGSTGSRLLSGNHTCHEAFEKFISSYFDVEAALLFNSGYDANVGLFSSVPQKRDVVIYDQLIHASIRDGIRLSQAQSYKFKHNDAQALKQKLEFCKNKFDEIYVVIESVYSMDGDQGPVKAVLELCKAFNAHLIIDEAHGLGVFGKEAKGFVYEWGLQSEVFATVYTFGKAVGAHGAVVTGSETLKQFLINFARSFIYTTALPSYAVKHIQSQFEQDWLQKQYQLQENIDIFRHKVDDLQLSKHFIESTSAIQCCIIPGNERVKRIVKQMNEKGFNVKPVLSPTVEKGKERIRFCIHSYNTKEEISALLQCLSNEIEAV